MQLPRWLGLSVLLGFGALGVPLALYPALLAVGMTGLCVLGFCIVALRGDLPKPDPLRRVLGEP